MRKFALSLVVLSLVAVPAFAGKYNKVISVGDKAPDFSGFRRSRTAKRRASPCPTSRKPLSSSSSWRITARSFRAYEDRVIDFTNDYKDKGVKVVGIAVSQQSIDKLPGIKDYMKEHKSNYIYGYDESQAVGKAYGATNTPQFFVLDKERKIRYTGAMDDSQTRRQGHQDLPPRRGRCRAQGRERRVEETNAGRLRRAVQEGVDRLRSLRRSPLIV